MRGAPQDLWFQYQLGACEGIRCGLLQGRRAQMRIEGWELRAADAGDECGNFLTPTADCVPFAAAAARNSHASQESLCLAREILESIGFFLRSLWILNPIFFAMA